MQNNSNQECANCKYFMFGSCIHQYGYDCNHSELWTPIGYGKFDISMFKLPDDVQGLIDIGIYTEEEVVRFIEVHGRNDRKSKRYIYGK